MEETTAYTEVPAPADTGADSGTGGAALLMGLLAMVLIYLVTELMPKIAAAVDRLFGIKGEKPPPAAAGDYKVKDIYEGEKNLDDDTDKKE